MVVLFHVRPRSRLFFFRSSVLAFFASPQFTTSAIFIFADMWNVHLFNFLTPPPPYLRPDVLWVAPSAIKTKTHTRFDRQKSSNSHYMFAISALSDRERGRSMRVRCRTTITISSILGGCLATPSPLHPNSPTLQEVNLEQTALTYPLLNSAKHGQDWIYRAISAVDSRC